MKKLSLLLVLIIILGAFSACAGIGDDTLKVDSHAPSFELSYEISKREYTRGETVIITASVKNISGEDLTYTAVNDSFYPTIELYSQAEGNEASTNITHEPIVTSSGSSEFTAKAGQVGKKEYTFIIPDDAKLGSYSITLNYRGDVCTYNDVLMVMAETSQNENSEYEYSPIAVSSGGSVINPIRTLSSSYVQHADGTSDLGCDGMGVWNYFDKDDTDISTFPLLVYGDNIGVEIPEYSNVYDVEIYDLNYKRINGYNLTSIEDINYLPAGDYLIVLSVQYDTSVRDPNEYEQYSYEDFFRIAIPSKNKNENKEYAYSSVQIKSGGYEIRPIQCMLWVEEHKNGEVVTGDGFGVSRIIEGKEDHSDFPALAYKGNIEILTPVNVYISRIEIYDTDYNKLEYSFDSLHRISYLLPGEYIVVFYEETDGRGCDPEITEYSIRANECIFKFIVPESIIKSFSFSDILNYYKSGDPGVKTEGFKNTSEQAVAKSTEAAERAKNECTVEYDTVTVQYDDTEKVWSVTFSTRGTLGGCQTVYLNQNGVTLLIVYGE